MTRAALNITAGLIGLVAGTLIYGAVASRAPIDTLRSVFDLTIGYLVALWVVNVRAVMR